MDTEIVLLDEALRALSDGNPDLLRVVSITGHEAINELFAFRVEAVAHPDLVTKAEAHGGMEHALLMTEVAFRLGPRGDRRHGMLNEVRVGGRRDVAGEPYTQLTLSVVPRAWLLTQRRNSRIFQGKYVDEIVSAILSENGVRHRWDLRHTYPKRIYCTQYEETDFEFVTRLFAEEGILFYFEHLEEFAGGDPASHTSEPTEADKNEEAARQVMTVAKSLAKEVGGAAKKTGDQGVEGGAGLAGSALGLASDLLRELTDDEDDHPKVLHDGSAGDAGSGDVLVFTDQADGYAYSTSADNHQDKLVVHLRSEAEMVEGENEAHEIVAGWRTAPEHGEMRDYDFRRPLLDLKARVGEELEEHQPGLPLEIYEHHGQYLTEDVTEEGTRVLLEQHRRDAALGHGRGTCARLCAGHRFHLDVGRSHEGESALGEGLYAVTRVEHEYYDPHVVAGEVEQEALIRGVAHAIHEAQVAGHALPEEQLRSIIQNLAVGAPGTSRAYKNRFTCVAAEVAYRPPRPARVRRHVTETATVMGPEGHDIYADRHGRVKVQFHWDREGEFNQKSSCWLRVAQPWAGAGYGFQFFPRCGMEVLVTFIGGDMDRPVVVGALYNGTHATPEPLPQRLTRSGIRTQTSPHGGGFNELSFEDAKNDERIYLHAQRNLEEMVNYDRNTTIGHSERSHIGGDQLMGIGGKQQTRVDADQATQVGGHQATFVGGDRTARVRRSQLDMIDGNSNTFVGGTSLRSVGTCSIEAVRGGRDVATTGHASLHVGTYTSDGDGYATCYVQGGAFVTAKRRVVVRIQEDEDPAGIRLECGTSVIEILPDRIVIDADKIQIRAKETIEQVSSGARIEMGDAVEVNGQDITLATDGGAGLVLSGSNALLTGSETKIHGGSIALNGSPAPATTAGSQRQDEDLATVNVKLKFTHLSSEESEPIAETPFRATSGELVIEDKTDRDGVASLDIPGDVRSIDINLYAAETYSDIYPETGGPLRWSLVFPPSLPPASELRGAKIRLMNLGYRIGDAALEKEQMDDVTEQALIEFQYDHQLPATGENDEHTQEKLEEAYGA